MDTSTKHGVFYEITDYAGILRRFFIIVVDLAVLLALLWVLAFAASFSDRIAGAAILAAPILCYAYLAGLKATPLGTVGYRLAGVRLSDLRGRQASIWRSTFRSGFLVFGPLNLFFDLIWLSGDPNRQSMRDKFAGTYVVRRKAMPAGNGPIDYKTYFIMTNAFVFAEVSRPAAESGER